ncbi:MAG TPA: hypothetical protein VHM26_11615 [Chitinophagaceae bacterium]|jgi:hypothetical protein|nr:hypothetical protein [Chitinophagaceae bacterium]
MKQDITLRYVLFIAIAVTATWLLHEFAHWAMGEYLGYDMALTLNTSYPVINRYKMPIDYQFVTIAGPLVTIIQAIVVFILLKRKSNIYLFAILLTCFYMRLMAMALSVSNPNDEARFGEYLGIGKFTLPLIVNLFLFCLVYNIVKQHRFKTRFIAITFALIILFSSVIILSDQYFKIRLL